VYAEALTLEERGKGLVIKVMKDVETGAEMTPRLAAKLPGVPEGTAIHSGNLVLADVEIGQNICREIGVPSEPCRFVYDTHNPAMVQRYIEESENLKFANHYSEWTPEMKRTVAGVFRRMRDEAVVWTDPNRGNYVLASRKAVVNGRDATQWGMAITDQDKICRMSEMTDRVQYEVLMIAAKGRDSVKAVIPGGLARAAGRRPFAMTLDEIWLAVLEHNEYVRFNGTRYEAGIFDLDTAALVIPDIKTRGPIDLRVSPR
jgi:hypothetical protein